MNLDYVQMRIQELRKAIENATYAGRDDIFHFYRGQLCVWEEVQRSQEVQERLMVTK